MKLYSNDIITIDVVGGKLSISSNTFSFIPLLPPSIARPNSTRTTREDKTYNITPNEEKEIIETATCNLILRTLNGFLKLLS